MMRPRTLAAILAVSLAVWYLIIVAAVHIAKAIG